MRSLLCCLVDCEKFTLKRVLDYDSHFILFLYKSMDWEILREDYPR